MRLSLHKRPRFLPTSLIPRAVRPAERAPKVRTVRDHLNDSMPPRPASHLRFVILVAVALTATTVALAAGRLARRGAPGASGSALAAAAEDGTRTLVDESLHRHLRALQ